MRSGIRRCVYVAFVVVGLLLVRTTSAQAQSDESTVAPSMESKFKAPSFHPKLQASFLEAAQAQLGPGNEDSGIGFGVSIMMVKNSFRGDDVFDTDSRTGLGFGFWVGGNRNGNVGFTGEFNFITHKVGEGATEGTLRILEIPAVFHINFGSRNRNAVGGYVVVGPAFSFKLKESFTGGFGSDNFGGVDIGIIGGLGIEFFRIGIEGRGNWGMKNISDEGDTLDIKTFKFELLGKFAFN